MSLSPGLDALERRRQRGSDERDAIQKKTFTKWVNKHLTKAGRNVADLFVDLQDGLNLIALLEALSSERLPRENGFTRFHRIQNVQYSLDFLKRKQIKLVNIRPEDIVEGNGKLTLGLIWTIILNFQVSVIKQRQQQELAESYIAASANPTSPSTLRQVSLLLLYLTGGALCPIAIPSRVAFFPDWPIHVERSTNWTMLGARQAKENLSSRLERIWSLRRGSKELNVEESNTVQLKLRGLGGYG
uniref:Calponin-homology (CH) domain-containing protein n=1 Tax=Steinernema glaseri TaxID=37863 RepID=A0A1I7YLI1_9BILA